jgi:rod shape-determining protein MreC
MESFVVRYRNLLVLLALLLVQIVGLAMQVHRADSGRMSMDARDSSGVRLIRLWANALVSPPERLIHSTGGGFGYLWQSYLDLRQVRSRNLELEATIDRLQLEQAALLEDARQGQRLQAILGFQQKYIYSTVPAQIIGSSGSLQSHVVTINKGEDAHLQHDMAVVTADGIVGKIREVFPHTAQVLLVNDQSSGAGVILESTRVRGVLRGNALGQTQIVGIVSDSRIQPGERVLTAGGDEIFPRGLPVGVVQKVVNDPDQDGFVRVIVKPSAHLDSLDEVLVITSTQPRFPPEQSADMTASAQDKSAELAQEEAQKKATEIMGERLPGLLDPDLPADQQPLNDSSNPVPVLHPPVALHPDRFTPGATGNSGNDAAVPGAAPKKPTDPANPQRNP